MKKIIFSTIFILTIAGFASAQTTKRGNSKTITYTSTTSHKAKKPIRKTNTAKIEPVNNSTTVIPDNRREYMQNGQLATYTGHQATPINTDEFQSEKKRAKKRKQ